MGTHPIFESDFDCLTEESLMIGRGQFFARRIVDQSIQPLREFSTSSQLARRGLTGSKTAFYSSLGDTKYKKFRTAKANRIYIPPVEEYIHLRSGAYRFNDKTRANSVSGHVRNTDNFMPMSRLPKSASKWDASLSYENRYFLNEIFDEKKNYAAEERQKTIQENLVGEEQSRWPIYKYKTGSRRTGMVMKKIGVEPMWLRDGTRVVSTILQVQNCHVIKYFPKHEFNGRTGAVIVGAGTGKPFLKNENYTQYCLDAGLTPKAHLARFPITENARLQPGTPLHVQHFHVGQYVDVVLKSVDFGEVDVVTRYHKKQNGKSPFYRKYHMRLSPGRWGNYRKVGSAGARGNTKVNLPNWYNEMSGRPLKGRRGPGQLGGADTVFWGRKVLRMNTEHQLIWVLGTVAGEIGSWARVYDSRTTKNDVDFSKEPPMFPTYYPELHGDEWADEIYDETLHPFDDESIKF